MARTHIKSAIRSWFETRGFIEADTACLQISPGNEAHLHAFGTELIGTDLTPTRLYLHTSPEFACKKLLAAGEEKIFTFAPVFRNRERGPIHHPEFTMLEWYAAQENYEQRMADCTEVLRIAAETVRSRLWSYRGHVCDPRADPERLTVANAFARYAGIDLLSTISDDGPSRGRFRTVAEAAGIGVGENDGWSDIFSRVLAAMIEPRLGIGRATLLIDYPVTEAALARSKPSDLRLAERFELYVCGIELANGFSELTNANEQRLRFETEMEEKFRIYGERYPIDGDFLAALAQMPAAAGCALGFDRLAMLATGADRIEQVIWTPIAEPGDMAS